MRSPTLARLRYLTASEIPFRIRERWVLLTDRRWRPPPAPDGPPPRWPWDEPPPEELPPWVEPVAPPWPGGPSAGIRLLGAPRDPRDAWEITRLQHLAARRSDPRALSAALRWLADNPPGRGIGWASAIEASLRLVSLVRIAAVHPHPALREAVWAHAAWISRHPSRGTSANNHRVAELGALALAARACGQPEAQLAELPEALEAQIHPDGVGVEQSPSYLAFDLEWALIARRCGVQGLDPAVARAASFLWTLLDSGGHSPAIGDDDGGRVIAAAPGPEPRYVASVAGAARAALGAPVPEGWTPDGRAAALGVVPTRPAPAGSACFPIGGLTILRRDRLQVIFDHGPLGGCTLAAHGHADALSVWVHLDGRPVVVSRGTGRYNADPLSRRFHRGTGASPTAILDGIDQSEPHDHPFLWRTRAVTALEEVDLFRGAATARCEGYRARGALHRRTVEVTDGRLTVIDRWLGDGRHHLAIRFPLAPGLRLDDDLWLLDGDRRIGRWLPDPALRARVTTGGERPGIGWHSPSYGVWVEACTVSFEGWIRLPAVFGTTLIVV